MKKTITITLVIIIIAIVILIAGLSAPTPGNPASWLVQPTITLTSLPTTTLIPSVIPGVARLIAINGTGSVKIGGSTYQSSDFALHGWPVLPHTSVLTTADLTQVELEIGFRAKEPAHVLICPNSSMQLSYGRNNIAAVVDRGFLIIRQNKSLAAVALQPTPSALPVTFTLEDGELAAGIHPLHTNIIWAYCVHGKCQLEEEENGEVSLKPGYSIAIDIVSGRMSVPSMLFPDSLSAETRCEVTATLVGSVNSQELSALANTPTPVTTKTPVIKTFSISGQVTDNETGIAISGVRILMNGPVWIDTFTDNTGFFTISGLPAGNYTLMTAKNGYIAQTRFLNLSDQDISDTNLSLSPPSIQTYTMTVSVTLDGQGLPNVFVLINGALRGKYGCVTAADGKCNLTGLRNDRYDVSGVKESYLIDTQVVYLLEDNPAVALTATRIK